LADRFGRAMIIGRFAACASPDKAGINSQMHLPARPDDGQPARSTSCCLADLI
jgi:hypothetical protein